MTVEVAKANLAAASCSATAREAVALLRDIAAWTAEGPLMLDGVDRDRVRAIADALEQTIRNDNTEG